MSNRSTVRSFLPFTKFTSPISSPYRHPTRPISLSVYSCTLFYASSSNERDPTSRFNSYASLLTFNNFLLVPPTRAVNVPEEKSQRSKSIRIGKYEFPGCNVSNFHAYFHASFTLSLHTTLSLFSSLIFVQGFMS